MGSECDLEDEPKPRRDLQRVPSSFSFPGPTFKDVVVNVIRWDPFSQTENLGVKE